MRESQYTDKEHDNRFMHTFARENVKDYEAGVWTNPWVSDAIDYVTNNPNVSIIMLLMNKKMQQEYGFDPEDINDQAFLLLAYHVYVDFIDGYLNPNES